MFLERFAVEQRGGSVKKELLGGATTFMTMSYIVFVQPVVLSAAGMDFGAVMTATCIASAIACLIMGYYANYPICLAPAMGHNFYFTYAVVLGMGIGWQAGLAAVFAAGVLFLILSLIGVRQKIIEALPASLTNAIASGIGLLIALIGLEWAGIIVDAPGTLVKLGNLGSPPTLLALFGLALTAALWARNVSGAILIGILTSTAIAVAGGLVAFEGIAGAPPSLAPTAFKLDLPSLLKPEMFAVVLTFLFLDMFDTMGTLIGIAPEAGLMVDGKLIDGDRAMVADASATVIGSLLSTSTITSYVESSTGIAAGARTGLAAIVAAGLFLLTPFFYPLAKMIGGGIAIPSGGALYPITAPALLIVGAMMMKTAGRIEWNKPADAVPAFLTMVIMPLSFSITDGIAFGLISYTFLAAAGGKLRKDQTPLYIVAGLLLARYIFL